MDRDREWRGLARSTRASTACFEPSETRVHGPSTGGVNGDVTFVIGPAFADEICVRCSVEVGLGFDLNAVIVWLTPSASMNCSRSSIFVLPLATECVACTQVKRKPLQVTYSRDF